MISKDLKTKNYDAASRNLVEAAKQEDESVFAKAFTEFAAVIEQQVLTEAQQQNPGETSLAVAGEVSPLPVAGSSSPTTAASQAPVAVDRRNQVDASLPDAKQPTAGPDVLPAVNLQSKLDGVIAIATPSSVAAMPQPAPLPLTVNQPPIPETNAETLTGTAPADSEQMPPATVTLKEFVPVKQLQMSADDQDKPAETAEPITDAVMPPQSAANSPNREAKEFRPDNDPFAVHGLADAPRASAKLAETVFAVADAAPQPDPDQYGIIRQIVDRARLYLRPGNQSEMVLQLRPEHLGELTVKVSVTSGLVNAAFHSDNPEVRQVIEAALPQLKQDLTQQGIKLDNVGVFSGSEQFFDNGQRSAQQQPPIPLRRNRRQLLQAVEAVETAAVTATDGVDYRI